MTYLSNLMEYIDTELAPLLEKDDRDLYRAFKDHFDNKPEDFYKARNVYLNFYFKVKDIIPILDISEQETDDDIDMQIDHVRNLLSKKLSHLFSKDQYCIEFGIVYKGFDRPRTYYTKKLPTNDAKNLIRNLLMHNHFITDDILEKYY